MVPKALFCLIFCLLLPLAGVPCGAFAGGVLLATTEPARQIGAPAKAAVKQGARESVARPAAAKGVIPESARLEVGWSMVRSKVNAYGATSRNENYREIWHLWRRSDGGLLLISPRAKVAVHQAIPDLSIVTNEGDLAALLGILPRPEEMGKAQSAQLASAMSRPVSIGIRDHLSPLKTSFNFGDEESFAVQLEVQNLRPE